VIDDTRLHLAAIDLARLKDAEAVKKYITEERKLTLKQIGCADSEIDQVIRQLAGAAEVEDLSRRKNRVDMSVADYFKLVAERWDPALLNKELTTDGQKPRKWDKWSTDQRLGQLHVDQLKPEALQAITGGLKLLPPENAKGWEGSKASDDDRLRFLKTQFGLARVIESAVSPTEAEVEEEEAATK